MKRIISKAAKICAVACVGVFAVVNSGWCEYMPPVVSYQTNDPELKTYLTLFESLEKGGDGVSGKEFDAAEHKEYLDRVEKNLRRSMADSFLMQSVAKLLRKSADEQLMFIDRKVDSEKRKPPRHHLALVPAGADAKDSSAYAFVQSAFNDQTLDQKFAGITVAYKFSSVQEMAEKAHALLEKFRPVFSANQGWNLQAPEASVSAKRNMIKELTSDNPADPEMKNIDPDMKNKIIATTEKYIKIAEAGEASFFTSWKSGLNLTSGTMVIPASNVSVVSMTPVIDPENGKYTLYVGMSRVTYQAKNK